MIHLAELRGCLTILEIRIVPLGGDLETRVRRNAKENAECVDRLFFNGRVLDVKVSIFRHAEPTPWVPLRGFCVAKDLELEAERS